MTRHDAPQAHNRRMASLLQALGDRPNRVQTTPRTLILQGVKLTLTVTALALLALAIIWPLTDTWPRLSPFTAENTADADRFIINNVRYGAQQTGGDFLTLEAKRLTQDALESPIANLETLTGAIRWTDGRHYTVEAAQGQIDKQNGVVRLWGGITARDAAGVRFSMPQAAIDTQARVLESATPVTGDGPGFSVQAEGLSIDDQGQRITLNGASRIILTPSGGETTP